MARRIIRVSSAATRRSDKHEVTRLIVAAFVVVAIVLATAISGVDVAGVALGLFPTTTQGASDAATTAQPASEVDVPEAESASTADEGDASSSSADYAAIASAPTDANGLAAATVTWVSDGDTLRVELNGATTHVRLLGIDTPESVAYDTSQNSEQGKQAAEHTKRLVHIGDTVWLQSEASADHDRYGRILRWVWLQEPSDPTNEDEVRSKMLDAIILRDGYAKTFWLYGSYRGLFLRLEEEARASGAGLWATGGDWGRSDGD